MTRIVTNYDGTKTISNERQLHSNQAEELASLKAQLAEAQRDAARYREALESVANSNYMPIGLVHTIRAVLYNQAMREGE